MNLELKDKVSLLPQLPGVYRFYDKDGKIIYVGKAKNLKKRVSSYFVSTATKGAKTLVLVRNIVDIQHTVVESEEDALLLENNFIKQNKPRYNILLKDDKTYPWIVIKKEPFPRVLQTRNLVKDGSQYFGPYPSVAVQRNILDVVRKIYSIRTCSLRLTEEGVRRDKFDRCLEYHIGNCKAPCTGEISKEEYEKAIVGVARILKGNTDEAYAYLNELMQSEAAALRFENAQKIKNKISLLDNYKSKSVLVSPTYNNMDIVSIISDNNYYYCNYLHIAHGAVVNSFSVELRAVIEETKEEVLAFALQRVKDFTGRELSREVVVPFLPVSDFFTNIDFTVPQRGDKLKLLELSQKNCKLFMLEKLKFVEKVNPERHTERVMSRMKSDLQMDVEPRHIECFDNSNIQGNYPVSSCVVFRDGKPSKKEYRHFNIKSVVGIDDFASMYETLTRRYSRVIEEGGELPDLIVVDGGKGQLSSAYEVLKELKIEHKVEIIGLAKRLEEVFFPNDSTPYYLDKSSETLKVLMHIRNEAHRFGITFHRNKRSKGFIISQLDLIPGIGKKSVEKLLTYFKTVGKIKNASHEELQKVVTLKQAKSIIEFFSNGENNNIRNE
ncbi:MAG: excinuclease ABC subunit UvrC [Rikenellaceae bacterium]